MKKENVVILGASDNPERYAYKAFKMLNEYHHNVTLVSPKTETVEGQKVLKTLSEVTGTIDTLTLYVNPSISSSLADEIIKLNPKRVIFNPGTENPELMAKLPSNIKSEIACTLVLLRTDQF